MAYQQKQPNNDNGNNDDGDIKMNDKFTILTWNTQGWRPGEIVWAVNKVNPTPIILTIQESGFFDELEGSISGWKYIKEYQGKGQLWTGTLQKNQSSDAFEIVAWVNQHNFYFTEKHEEEKYSRYKNKALNDDEYKEMNNRISIMCMVHRSHCQQNGRIEWVGGKDANRPVVGQQVKNVKIGGQEVEWVFSAHIKSGNAKRAARILNQTFVDLKEKNYKNFLVIGDFNCGRSKDFEDEKMHMDGWVPLCYGDKKKGEKKTHQNGSVLDSAGVSWPMKKEEKEHIIEEAVTLDQKSSDHLALVYTFDSKKFEPKK